MGHGENFRHKPSEMHKVDNSIPAPGGGDEYLCYMSTGGRKGPVFLGAVAGAVGAAGVMGAIF